MTTPTPRRTCIFCGATDLTREHIFRRALKKYVDDPNIETSLPRDSSTPPPVFERTVKRACASCNNGWMNDLENRVEPVLSEMIRGRVVLISDTAAADLATWAVKTAITRSYADPDRSLLPVEATWLYKRGRPRGTWQVMLGRTYSPAVQDRSYHFDGHSFLPGSPPRSPRDLPGARHWVQQHILNIGEMLLVTTNLAGPGPVIPIIKERMSAFFGNHSYPFARLFPDGDSVQWPGADSISTEGMGSLVALIPRLNEEFSGQPFPYDTSYRHG